MRERWLGATGIRVPEIAVEGEDVELPDDHRVLVEGTVYDALVLDRIDDVAVLTRAHGAGLPVVVRTDTPAGIRAALARPEVACAVVPQAARGLQELDLTELTYG